MWIDVELDSPQKINELINILIRLRDEADIDHIHLQDFGLSPDSGAECAEVVLRKTRKFKNPLRRYAIWQSIRFFRLAASSKKSANSGN